MNNCGHMPPKLYVCVGCLQARIRELEAQNDRLNERTANLQRRIDAFEKPRTNYPIVAERQIDAFEKLRTTYPTVAQRQSDRIRELEAMVSGDAPLPDRDHIIASKLEIRRLQDEVEDLRHELRIAGEGNQ